MTPARVIALYALAAVMLVPLMTLLHAVVAVELVLSVLFATTIGLIASKEAPRGHVLGLLLIQLILVAAWRVVIRTDYAFGSLQVRSDDLALPFGIAVVLIVAVAKMIVNRTMHWRFLHGGSLSGLYAATMTFAVLTFICAYSAGQSLNYAQRGFTGLVMPISIFGPGDRSRQISSGATVLRTAWLLYSPLLLVVLLLLTSFNRRGSVMPRFLRAPRPLPSLKPSRGGTQ